MSRYSKLLAHLSAQEKRALLRQLLQKETRELMSLLDRFAMTVTELKAEVVLDPAIRLEGKAGEPVVAEPNHIFLTGATGFLGAFLLYELLQCTSANIYCLVRAPTAEEGKERILRNLRSYLLWHEELSPRIIPVVGDLSEPLLGLSTSQFRTLADTIELIYHNGASVKWIYPYENLKPANVLGTQEVLRLACLGQVKPVHFVSTLAVFPLLSNSQTRVYHEEASLYHDGVLYGGYTQSKWVAENLVTIARSRGIPVCIYRAAYITGHSQTGANNTDDVLCALIKNSIKLKSVPDINRSSEAVTPVDYVSKAIVYLSRQKESIGKAFHLVNSHAVYWKEFFDWIRSFGYPLQTIPYDMWRAKLLDRNKSREDTANLLASLLSLSLSEDLPGLARNLPRFECQNTLKSLAGSSIVCPPVDRKVVKAYLSYLIQSGFLDAPPGGISKELPYTQMRPEIRSS